MKILFTPNSGMLFLDTDSLRLSETLFDDLLMRGCRIAGDDNKFLSLLEKRGITGTNGGIPIEGNITEASIISAQKQLKMIHMKICAALEEAATI